jgi:hypothetical protein
MAVKLLHGAQEIASVDEPTAPHTRRARAVATLRAGRPRRGTPAPTPPRLRAAAAGELNRVG